MNQQSHVFDFLAKPLPQLPVGVCVLFGGERFLKTLAIAHLTGSTSSGDNLSVSRFDSSAAGWSDVHDELSTRSLFGGDGPRIVIIDDADKFVSENRERLEDFAAGQGGIGLLVLVVENWSRSTRLFKQVEKSGYQVDCGPPRKSARSKSADPAKTGKWLIQRARQEYDVELPAPACQWLIDLTDGDFGRMDQELQKIALFADDQRTVPLETIKQVVGGWRNRTMWEAVDAALDGDAGKALDLLDLIFRGGEHPLALFGSLSWSLRRYANATETVLRQMRSGRKPNLQAALKDAGLGGWGGENAESHLKQVGSARARQLSQWILESDLQLKRTHTTDGRGRLVLEKLLIRLADGLRPLA